MHDAPGAVVPGPGRLVAPPNCDAFLSPHTQHIGAIGGLGSPGYHIVDRINNNIDGRRWNVLGYGLLMRRLMRKPPSARGWGRWWTTAPCPTWRSNLQLRVDRLFCGPTTTLVHPSTTCHSPPGKRVVPYIPTPKVLQNPCPQCENDSWVNAEEHEVEVVDGCYT